MNISFFPASFALIIIGRIPLTPLIIPSSANSPTKFLSQIASVCNCPLLHNIPTAIGKSSPEPSFFKSAGARLTVIRVVGNLNPEFFKAARTLSLDSLTAVSGSPTSSNAGRPFEISTSTIISSPLIPHVVSPKVFAYMSFATYYVLKTIGNMIYYDIPILNDYFNNIKSKFFIIFTSRT